MAAAIDRHYLEINTRQYLRNTSTDFQKICCKMLAVQPLFSEIKDYLCSPIPLSVIEF